MPNDSVKRMVFHAPFPVREGATSASGIRPWKMLQAFKAAGYQVFEVTGYAAQRRSRFASLKRGIRAGWKPDFVYSEAATIPSSFTERKHFPLVLNLERNIFRYFHDLGVPSGVFYRDVYWAFEDYERSVGKPVALAMRRLYAREIETFNRFVDVVFLPTEQMGPFVPGLSGPKQIALPPGCETVALNHQPQAGNLNLLYVGAVGGHHYDIGALLDAVKETPEVELTICTRPDQWQVAIQDDPRLLGERIRVVHESGSGLEPLYEAADVACLVMKPQEYRSFAAPMKLYEYLGHGKPVLTSEGTYAAGLIAESGAGWVVPFAASAVSRQLEELVKEPAKLAEATQMAERAGGENTWDDRVRRVAEVLQPASAATSKNKKRHAMVVPSWYPKDTEDIRGSFFREQAEAMQRAGWDVGVLALELDPIYNKDHRSARVSEVAEEAGIRVIRGTATTFFPLQRWLNLQVVRRRLFSAFDDYVAQFGEPDVLHAHSLYPGAFLASALARRYGIPFVYTEHRTLSHLPARSELAKRVERQVVQAARSRHGVSKGHATHLTSRFGDVDFLYTPNLLPTVSSATTLGDQPVGGEKDGTYTFGHLSNFDPVKRVDAIVDAFAEVWRQDETVRLVLGGSGQEDDVVRQQVDALGVESVVTFLGNLERSEVPAFYASIDCFVLPSVTEPMGVVQIEALAAGVPVISTRTWGGTTVVEHGDGLLVEIDDQDDLVAAMRQIRETPQSEDQREARRQRCIDRFGEQAFVERYDRIYQEAIRQQ